MNASVRAKGRKTDPIPLHRLLREIYRNYLRYRTYVADTGIHVIEHGYYTYEDDGETIKNHYNATISFWDLHRGVKDLSERKKEAFLYNVIFDMKQVDVAAIMGITTVSVGQYVEQAMLSLSKEYFAVELEELVNTPTGAR